MPLPSSLLLIVLTSAVVDAGDLGTRDETALSTTTVSAGPHELVLQISLPHGLAFNPKAPTHARLDLSGATGVRRVAEPTVDIASGKLVLRAPIDVAPTAHGPVVFEVALYYCSETHDAESVCRVHRRRLRQELAVADIDSPHEVLSTYQPTEDGQ